MRLIANKPCSFGGQQFYIGDEVPVNLVADAKMQEKYGVITIASGDMGVSTGQSVPLFTQKQVEKMIAEAVEEAEKKREDQMAELQGYAAELEETRPGTYAGAVQITVKGASDGQFTAIPAKPEEIQQVFSIMQMNAEEGAKVIADITSENVLILLHAADSRRTIKNAAKEQADKLFSTEGVSNESGKSDEITEANIKGADT